MEVVVVRTTLLLHSSGGRRWFFIYSSRLRLFVFFGTVPTATVVRILPVATGDHKLAAPTLICMNKKMSKNVLQK
jgi:hypothetical protein